MSCSSVRDWNHPHLLVVLISGAVLMNGCIEVRRFAHNQHEAAPVATKFCTCLFVDRDLSEAERRSVPTEPLLESCRKIVNDNTVYRSASATDYQSILGTDTMYIFVSVEGPKPVYVRCRMKGAREKGYKVIELETSSKAFPQATLMKSLME